MVNVSYLKEIQAAKEWAPQEVKTTLTQSCRQLLMRPMAEEVNLSQKNEIEQKHNTIQPGDDGQLLSEKSM